jgi:UDP-3-O-[3-hydroxymyristoyl] glucosamine N-acyltransferase
MKSFSTQEITKAIDGTLIGDGDIMIDAPEQIDKATANQITFIGDAKYLKKWPTSNAGAAIVNEQLNLDPPQDGKALISVKNADLAMAQVLELFAPPLPSFDVDIHPNATIDESAELGQGVKIGPNVFIGKNVKIGDGVQVYPNVTIMDNCTIGQGTILWSGVVIRERCKVGALCILHNNVSIGADGFGYRPSPDGRGLIKIPQIGDVIIGNGVEIGANSCVDRGKFSSTIIGDGCKIDNLVMIAHNCVLGRSCIMAGASGLAGSVTLGDGVIIGGGTCIKDHVTLGNGVKVGACSGVMHDVEDGKTVLGYPAYESRETLRYWAHLRKIAKGKL